MSYFGLVLGSKKMHLRHEVGKKIEKAGSGKKLSHFLMMKRLIMILFSFTVIVVLSVFVVQEIQRYQARRETQERAKQSPTMRSERNNSTINSILNLESAKKAILEYAWKTELGPNEKRVGKFNASKDEISIEDDNDPVFFRLTGIGDPDRDGLLEASGVWRSRMAHGVSGWPSSWGIVEYSSNGCREEPWYKTISNSAQEWITSRHPNAVRAFSHLAVVNDNSVDMSVHAFYPDDANCCPRYSGKLTYEFDSHGRPTLVREDVKRRD
jgi:cell division protein FtsL